MAEGLSERRPGGAAAGQLGTRHRGLWLGTGKHSHRGVSCLAGSVPGRWLGVSAFPGKGGQASGAP